MPDYMKMYAVLFNAITDALNELDHSPEEARSLLIAAQQKTEEIYVEASDESGFGTLEMK